MALKFPNSNTGNTFVLTQTGIQAYDKNGKRMNFSIFCQQEKVEYKGNGVFHRAGKLFVDLKEFYTNKNIENQAKALYKKYSKGLTKVGNTQEERLEFLKKMIKLAKSHNCDPESMLVMFYSEGCLDPKSKGGIFGCMDYTAENVLGTKLETIRGKTASQQLDYYEKALDEQLKMVYGDKKNWPKKIPPSIMYAMNFTPAYVKDAIKSPSKILVSANDKDPKKRRFYKQNCGEGSIADGKSYISLDTIQTRLNNKRAELLKL